MTANAGRVTFADWRASTKPWCVDYSDFGKRKRRFFRTKDEADSWLRTWRVNRTNEGRMADLLTAAQRLEAHKAIELLKPFDKGLLDAARHYAAHLELLDRTCTVNDLYERLYASKKSDKKSVRYLADLRARLTRFLEDFDQRNISTIQPLEIGDWLNSLGVSATTRNNFRTVLYTFFAFAVDTGFAKENPIEKIKRAKTVSEPPKIFTQGELARLLTVADPEIIPAIAIGAFAGLRRAEIDRLKWQDIQIDRGYIEVSAKNAKSARRRLVQILPILKEWLLPYSFRTGRLRNQNERLLLKEAMEAAKIKEWPDNGLRHSYASYHLAKFKDASRLALELGHTDSRVVFAHYREVVTPEEAGRYWSILPESKQEGKDSKIVNLKGAAK